MDEIHLEYFFANLTIMLNVLSPPKETNCPSVQKLEIQIEQLKIELRKKWNQN